MYTLAHALRRADGERRGRATLRLAMVVAFLIAQAIEFTDPGLLSALHIWSLPSLCLCGLGASLGFGIASDRGRMTARSLASGRVRRAYPVYAFTILSAVFVLGPIVTDGNRSAYISDGQTLVYLLNLVGIPVYDLPGVFEFNDIPRIVNALVWLAPVCAAMLAVACLPIRNRWARAVPVFLLGAAMLGALIVQGLAVTFEDGGLAASLARGDALSAVLGGLAGITLYRLQRRIPSTTGPAAGAAVLLAGLAVAGNAGWLGTAAFRIAAATPAAYLTVFLTVRRLAWSAPSGLLEPYLAGAMLLAFPLQQLMAARTPQAQSLPLHLAVIVPAFALSAAFRRAIGRRLMSPSQEEVTGPDAMTAKPVLSLRSIRRLRQGPLLQNLALALVMSGVFIGVMILLYTALQPDAGT